MIRCELLRGQPARVALSPWAMLLFAHTGCSRADSPAAALHEEPSANTHQLAGDSSQARPAPPEAARTPANDANSAAIRDKAPTVAPSPQLTASCDELCAHTKPLKCPRQDQCKASCVAMGNIPACADAFATLYGCLVHERIEHWECAEDGIAAIRDGYCESEQSAASRCLEARSR
jgi:hypothetical protein